MTTVTRQVMPPDGLSTETAENSCVVSLAPLQVPLEHAARHNVLVIAANRLLRDLLCDLVAAKPELHLAGSESFANPGALESVNSSGNSVVLLWLSEISTPEHLLAQIETVRAASGNSRIVLIGMPAVEQIFLTAVRAGVAGYVLDDAPMEEVLTAVDHVARGEVVCPSRLLPDLFRCVATQAGATVSQGTFNRLGLSRREQQLIPLIARGMTNKEIASELCLSEQTVKNHLRRMMRKAGAANRFAIVERCQMDAGI